MSAAPQATSQNLVRSGMIVSFLLFFAKLTGLARDAGLAAVFGTGIDLQAYAVGMLGSGFVTGALLVTSLSGTLVPAYTSRRDNVGESAAFAHWLSLGRPLFLGAVLLASLAYVFAEPITGRLGPGLAPAARDLAVQLSRGFALSIPLSFVAGWFGALLHANRRFVEVGLRSACINVALIAGMAVLAPELGAWSLWLGTILGNVLEILIQLPFVVRKWKALRGERADPKLGLFLHSYLPLVSVSLCLNMMTLLDRSYSTLVMSVGAAMMMYADRLVEISRALVGRTIAMVLLPELGGGENTSGSSPSSGAGIIQRSLSVVTVLTIPMAFGFALYGPSLSYWIFLGRLSPEDLRVMGGALTGLSGAAVLFPIVWVLDRVFASRAWSKFFLAYVASGIGVNWGVKALMEGKSLFWVGAASSTGLLVMVCLSVLHLQRKLESRSLRPYFLDAVGALFCFALPMYAGRYLLAAHYGGEWQPLLTTVVCGLSVMIGMACYWIMDFPFWSLLPQRFRSPLRARLSIASMLAPYLRSDPPATH